MKFKNLFISLGLVLAVGAGIGTVLSVKDNYQEAKAVATTSADQLVFFEAPQWDGNLHTFEIHYWNSDKSVSPYVGLSLAFTTSDSKNIYYGILPSGMAGFQLKFNQNDDPKYTNNIEGANLPSDGKHVYYLGSYDGSTGNFNWGTYQVDTKCVGLRSDDKLYVTTGNGSGNNVIGDASGVGIAVYFYNSSASAWSGVASAVVDAKAALGSTNVPQSLYEITIPKSNSKMAFWTTMVVARYKIGSNPSQSGWNWGVDCFNQTHGDDISLKNSFTTVKLTYYYSESPRDTMQYTLDSTFNFNDVHSNIFGYHIISNTASICKDDSVSPTPTNLSDLGTAWSTLKAEYIALPSATQGVIWLAEADEEGTTYLAKGLARYDYIVLVKKYKNLVVEDAQDKTDFINRDDEDSGSAYHNVLNVVTVDPKLSSDSNSSAIVVATISAVSILAVGGYFFIKRKADK